MCASWCTLRAVGRGWEQGVFSDPGSLLPQADGRAGEAQAAPLGYARAQGPEHRLLSVPLGKILHSLGLCFFVSSCPPLETRVAEPLPQVCRRVSGVAQRGLRLWPSCEWVEGGMLLGQPGIIKSESLGSGGICSYDPDSVVGLGP